MKEVTKIPKAQVAVASRGLHPKFLYIGTRKMPPPSPNPLNMPAPMLLMIISFVCYSILCLKSRDSWPSITLSSGCQLFKIRIFRQAQAMVNRKEKRKKNQQAAEHGANPIIEGNLEEPRINERAAVISINAPIFLKIKIFLSFLKGQIRLSSCKSTTFSAWIKFYSLYLRYSDTKRWQVFLIEITNTIIIIEQVAKLGSNLFIITPTKDPVNIIGIEANAK